MCPSSFSSNARNRLLLLCLVGVSMRDAGTRALIHTNVVRPILTRIADHGDTDVDIVGMESIESEGFVDGDSNGWKFKDFDSSGWKEQPKVKLRDSTSDLYFK